MQRKADLSIGYRAYATSMLLFGTPKVASARLGIERKTFYAWKFGTSPSALFLAKLAWAGADVNYILTGRRTNHDKF